MPLTTRPANVTSPTRSRTTRKNGAFCQAMSLAFGVGLQVWVPQLRAQTPDTAEAHNRNEATGSAMWVPQILGTQANVIAQHLAKFRSLYQGAMSLTPSGSDAISHTYGIYAGASLWRGLEAYVDIEMARGKGISHASGLAGVTNGDVIRQGTADLGSGPYVARVFLRYTRGVGAISKDTLARAPDQLPVVVSANRLEMTAGKLAASDLFDLNRYANSTRFQFMNWGLFQNTAWDFAADTRGYTNGMAVGWVTPLWTLRFGSFQMPREANGNKFDAALGHARGDNAELSLAVLPRGGIVRILGYINHARMGDYREAIARAVPGTSPNIVADDRPGRVKRGFGLNLEQPVADGGESGFFARWGWNDGRTESFAFTEVEGHLSIGVQVSGIHWLRAEDRAGVALLRHCISSPHRDYLSRGGLGFLLGDGALNYGAEQVVEGYYRAQLGPYVEIGPDLQYISNPGYNRDRGPARVSSLRINIRY
jgi:high affinity Mn2+ porin